jgi:hypothetical protein
MWTVQEAPSDPAPSDPAPSDPAPSDPAPSDPAPSDPAPSDPAFVRLNPTRTYEIISSGPAPSDPAPSGPTTRQYQRISHCQGCGLTYPLGELVPVEALGSGRYCQHCLDALVFECSQCHSVHRRYDAYIIDHGGPLLCLECYERRPLVCERCGDSYTRNSRYLFAAHDYCRACFAEMTVRCHNCGCFEGRDAQRTHNGQAYCRTCADDLLDREWDTPEYSADVTGPFDLVGSTRKFGIELETHRCEGYRELKPLTVFGCKPDCSISGMEFISPVLYGNAGFSAIADFCKLAVQRRFRVDTSCGYHAHFDLSEEPVDALRKVASAYLKTRKFWFSLVGNDRWNNSMCGGPDYTAEDAQTEDWEYFVAKRDRFEFVNWRAYLVHGTIEVRLYQGTLDCEEICNWVAAHARFIDWAIVLDYASWDNLQWEDMQAVLGDELFAYWDAKRSMLEVLRDTCEDDGVIDDAWDTPGPLGEVSCGNTYNPDSW